jgi:hypothetical protein
MTDDLLRLLALDDSLRAHGVGLSPALRRLLAGRAKRPADRAAQPATRPDRPSNVVAFPAPIRRPAKEARDGRG